MLSLSPFCLVLDHPRRLCLPHPGVYSLGTLLPLPSSVDLSTTHGVCRLNCLSPGDSIWCFYVQTDPTVCCCFCGFERCGGILVSSSAHLLFAPFSLGTACTPPHHPFLSGLQCLLQFSSRSLWARGCFAWKQ